MKSENGLEVNPENVKSLERVKSPTNLVEVGAVLALVGFY